jgi:DNA-binding CsgD family transcriptional regulator/transposase-like protein
LGGFARVGVRRSSESSPAPPGENLERLPYITAAFPSRNNIAPEFHMPRKRTGTVTETLEELDALLERHRGTPAHARLRALRLIKTDPGLQWPEIAERIGCPAQTLKRWWADYREQGMQFLSGSNSGRPGQTSRANADKKPRDVRSIISDGCEVSEIVSNYEIDSNGWVDLLCKLPDTSDVKEWVDGIRTILHTLFSDIDRISVSVNSQCDLRDPESYEPHTSFIHVFSSSRVRQRLTVARKKAGEHVADIIEGFKHSNFPFTSYHPPCYLVLRYKGVAYLGTFFFWRDKEKPEISSDTLRKLLGLETFLTFIMSDYVVRSHYFNATFSQIPDRLDFFIKAAGLTKQERSVALHAVLGYSYDQIADLLCISLDTVRHHMKSIYRKTGTHSDAELFAKYFAAPPPAEQPHR